MIPRSELWGWFWRQRGMWRLWDLILPLVQRLPRREWRGTCEDCAVHPWTSTER